MFIANPIYDAVFKFLLEDPEVAKRFLSILIGEEILELDIRPQEQSMPSVKYFLTVFRIDFKAIIKTADGETKKVLIELQKSKNPFDLERFRTYLGSNYKKPDEINNQKTTLPILPIYFLGFKLSVDAAILKIGRSYQDPVKGVIFDTKDDFIEKLSHDCIIVQIPRLPPNTQTKLEQILSVFNQRWVFDKEQKWVMQYTPVSEDPDLSLIIKRLSMATMDEDVQENIQSEEDFDDSMDAALRDKEQLLANQEQLLANQEQLLASQKQLISEKDQALQNTQKQNEDLLRYIAELEKKIKKD